MSAVASRSYHIKDVQDISSDEDLHHVGSFLPYLCGNLGIDLGSCNTSHIADTIALVAQGEAQKQGIRVFT